MEASKSFEAMVSYCNPTWHHNPEDNMNLHNHENLKFHDQLFARIDVFTVMKIQATVF
jgi:hypothetical protein